MGKTQLLCFPWSALICDQDKGIWHLEKICNVHSQNEPVLLHFLTESLQSVLSSGSRDFGGDIVGHSNHFHSDGTDIVQQINWKLRQGSPLCKTSSHIPDGGDRPDIATLSTSCTLQHPGTAHKKSICKVLATWSRSGSIGYQSCKTCQVYISADRH